MDPYTGYSSHAPYSCQSSYHDESTMCVGTDHLDKLRPEWSKNLEGQEDQFKVFGRLKIAASECDGQPPKRKVCSTSPSICSCRQGTAEHQKTEERFQIDPRAACHIIFLLLFFLLAFLLLFAPRSQPSFIRIALTFSPLAALSHICWVFLFTSSFPTNSLLMPSCHTDRHTVKQKDTQTATAHPATNPPPPSYLSLSHPPHHTNPPIGH